MKKLYRKGQYCKLLDNKQHRARVLERKNTEKETSIPALVCRAPKEPAVLSRQRLDLGAADMIEFVKQSTR